LAKSDDLWLHRNLEKFDEFGHHLKI